MANQQVWRVWRDSNGGRSGFTQRLHRNQPVSGRSRGSNDGEIMPLTAVPFGFYTHKLDDQWAVGFGVYAPFGLAADYEKGSQGRAFGSDAVTVRLR